MMAWDQHGRTINRIFTIRDLITGKRHLYGWIDGELWRVEREAWRWGNWQALFVCRFWPIGYEGVYDPIGCMEGPVWDRLAP